MNKPRSASPTPSLQQHPTNVEWSCLLMLGQVSQGRGPPYIADELSPQTQALQSKLESEGASLWTATPAWPTSSLELEDGKNSFHL
ncbi:hypothetical protein PCASD_11508 [Puccinia coronata f. sp. avenae]|uniref:Uncharacterized protein n=1 Tax=Puccinia coronata f. sp. avenae TaxID=200324 RepID=A0A2N5UM61_9BASI|nr:hypothetical protein PCASD_11508 [Puccinia coronata f. sp. avenae]